jgi:hypothetical protein
MPNLENLAEDAGRSVTRQGAWATLAVALVLAILAGICYVGAALIPLMQDFIQASAESTRQNAASVAKMTESMQSVHDAHRNMMQSQTSTLDAVKSNGDLIAETQEQMRRVLDQMDTAYKMMSNVPTERQEQIELLRKIEAGITALRNESMQGTN